MISTNNRIRLVHFVDDLDWFDDGTWHEFRLPSRFGKREIMQWLAENTHGQIIVCNAAEMPMPGTYNWHNNLSGQNRDKIVLIENAQDALLFKLRFT